MVFPPSRNISRSTFRIAENVSKFDYGGQQTFTAKPSQEVSDPVVSYNVVTCPLAAGGMIAELVDGLHAKGTGYFIWNDRDVACSTRLSWIFLSIW